MTRSCRDTGAVFLLVNVNEGWQGCAHGLGQLFLNLSASALTCSPGRGCPGTPRRCHTADIKGCPQGCPQRQQQLWAQLEDEEQHCAGSQGPNPIPASVSPLARWEQEQPYLHPVSWSEVLGHYKTQGPQPCCPVPGLPPFSTPGDSLGASRLERRTNPIIFIVLVGLGEGKGVTWGAAAS